MRGSSPDSLTGFVNLAKPADMTSSDAVCIVRGVLSRIIGGKQKTGHMGTLDPLAEGVLPVALGKATRLFDVLAFKTKQYTAEFTFGKATDTLDRGGKVLSEGGRIPTADEIKSVLPRFTGEIEQIPPAYSAKSVDGKRAYAYARQGIEPPLAPKRVTVNSIALTGGNDGVFTFGIECGGGTYIRALARDIAQALGTTAYMSKLTRTRSGVFTLADAVSVDAFRAAPEKYILPAEFALCDMPEIVLNRQDAERILNGVPIRPATAAEVHGGEYCKVYAEGGGLLGVGHIVKDGLRLKVRL